MINALKVAAMSCVLAAAAGDNILNQIKDFGACPDGKLNDCTEPGQPVPLGALRVQRLSHRSPRCARANPASHALRITARALAARSTDFASEWPYAHAYTASGVAGAPFAYQTVMGASSPRCLGTVRLATFSSAADWDSYWLLFRRGSATRDNARVLQDNRLYVANYRSSA
ncbi:hypothetical protein JKP88DRAFT_249757 [Tribonema minus]|uniref:Uncharacterized protein n=1 Tax=Tribonema minus TaxID=303371 RepID=A0A836C991_9STRA|nr:hypothetical protein JKP88DRAFT_249757 [Tribonema minus]